MSPCARSPDLLESRVWNLLYRMGFTHLSSIGGATLILRGGSPKSPTQQIDVVAVDDEVAIAVECKSQKTPKKDPRFTEKLTKIGAIRRKFSESISSSLAAPATRHVATAMFTWDIEIRESDEERAREEDVFLFDERDLEYYEALVSHVGPAARYQLLAELFKGRQVRGLELKVPALRTRMGPFTCYTFSVRPDYLLKIAYVAHRAKGKVFDIDSYQRMLSKARLHNIADYITEDGIFPTNIVINVTETKYLRFERGKQEGERRDAGGTFGWLTLSPTYGAAWIIDGQHRLFAYSGHPRAGTSYLNVLAFEALSPSKQTQQFVDINSEQRRVKRSLLVELDATLKWDSENDQTRVSAIISKLGMALDELPKSPFRDRILLADVKRTPTRCVSLTSLFTAINKPGFFIVTKKKSYTQYGPLWREDPNLCLRRSTKVLVDWLQTISSEARDWWQLGAEDGGGLAMNDGVTVCVNMLRSVLDHLNTNGSLSTARDDELVNRLKPYAKKIGAYFARMSPDERLRFRGFRGVEGQTNATRECQFSLQESFPKFQVDGLSEWMERRDANTNEEGRRIIDVMEKAIQDHLLGLLRSEFDANDDSWFFDGVPISVRKKVDERINEAGGGKREENFDLVHYEAIIKKNWRLFKPVFAFGSGDPGKDRGTAWLREVVGWRNKVMHPSRRDFLGLEELTKLQEYHEWLRGNLEHMNMDVL